MSEEYVNKIREILLKHKGRKNAVFSRDMADMLGIKEGSTHARTRRFIWVAIKRYELPVAAVPHDGYFYITSREELIDYLRSLKRRISNTEKRRKLVLDNYIKRYGKVEYNEEEV